MDTNISKRKRATKPEPAPRPVSQLDADGFTPKVRAIMERGGVQLDPAKAEADRKRNLEQVEEAFAAVLGVARGAARMANPAVEVSPALIAAVRRRRRRSGISSAKAATSRRQSGWRRTRRRS